MNQTANIDGIPARDATSAVEETTETEARPKHRRAVLGICIFLAAITFVVFGRTTHYNFVNFDDGIYVYQNPVVTGSFSLESIAARFAHAECNFYHPLTMISL